MAGRTYSKVNFPPRPLGLEYMCIAIFRDGSLHIILGSDEEAAIVRQSIQEAWPKGIQKETFELNGVHEFNLKGNPFFTGASSSDAIACRRMAERILHRLYQNGWKLHMSSNLMQESLLTTWFFKKVPVVDFSPQPFLVVGLSGLDSLMILNAPMDLHQLFRDAIERSWPNGIQKWTYENEVLMIKLKGYPWVNCGPHDEDKVPSILILQTIISDLKQWNLYGNSNIRNGGNTLFFDYSPNMVPAEQHFIITFNSTDLLRVIGAPESLVSAVRSTVQSVWVKGIDEESRYLESWQFKLRGTPWWASGDEAVESSILVMKLMEALLAQGWSPVSAIYSLKGDSDKSSLLFRQCQPRQSPFCCVTLIATNKLRLINASEDIIKICQDVIKTQYFLGIQKVQRHDNSMEFKLMGEPWTSLRDGHDGIHARNMICHLISALAIHGWMAVISADISAEKVYVYDPDYPVIVERIFFMYDPAAVAARLPTVPSQTPHPTQPYLQSPSCSNVRQAAPSPVSPPTDSDW